MKKIFNTSTEKRLIVDYLKPFFNSNSIKGKNAWSLLYEVSKQVNEYTIYNGAFVFSNHTTPCYGDDLSIIPVEDLILEIQYPNHDFSSPQGPSHTINHRSNEYPEYLRHFHGKFEKEEDYIDFADAVKHYIETDGQKFIEHYSYLPNVLAEMDKLEQEGKYWHELISGGPEYFFRVLIISKLCGDSMFEHKLAYIHGVFHDAQYKLESWLPYYNKLKERLKTVEPLYNLK